MLKKWISAGFGSQEADFHGNKIIAAILYFLIFLCFYFFSIYNYLLFHTIVELFSIYVGSTIFIIAWNSRRMLNNNYLLFLGIAFLFIAFLDLIHTLSYKGMPIFIGYDSDLPTQFWIAARYMESITLFSAPIFFKRHLNSALIFIIYLAVTFMILVSIFWVPVFPSCYIEGAGLTDFKKNSEYIISLILFGALFLLFRNRFEFDDKLFRLLAVSIILTIFAELSFTFYMSVYGLSNLVGHFLKLVSFFLIYLAIIRTGIKDPYRFLSKELKESHENLEKSEEKYRSLFELMEEGFLRTDRNEIIRMANLSMARLCGYNSPDEIIGQHIKSIYVHPEERDAVFLELLENGVMHNREILNKTKSGRKFWSLSNLKLIQDENKNIIGTEELVRDITDIKQASDDLLSEKKKLEKALAEIRTLRGIIPICCVCKKIRDDKGYWNQIEAYVKAHSDAEFSHGICPECAKNFYGEDIED